MTKKPPKCYTQHCQPDTNLQSAYGHCWKVPLIVGDWVISTHANLSSPRRFFGFHERENDILLITEFQKRHWESSPVELIFKREFHNLQHLRLASIEEVIIEIREREKFKKMCLEKYSRINIRVTEKSYDPDYDRLVEKDKWHESYNAIDFFSSLDKGKIPYIHFA